jgi:lysophospholipase L1-like esterase
MRRGVRFLAVLVVVTLLGLIVAELLARVVFTGHMPILSLTKFMESERGKFARYDPLLGWIGKEDVEDDFKWVDTESHVSQNRYGFRGLGYDFKKGEKKRLLVLGDSFVWGFGVDNEELFTHLMESGSPDTLEVINLGVSGYTTDQEYLLWRKLGSKWTPEDVVLFILPTNDLKELLDSSAHGYKKPNFVFDQAGNLQLKNTPVPQRWVWEDKEIESEAGRAGRLNSMLSRSTLANLVVGILIRNENAREYLESKKIIPGRTNDGGKNSLVYASEPTGDVKKGWRLLFKLLGHLDDSVSKNGGRLRVVVVPSSQQVYPKLWESYVKLSSIPKGVKLDPDATFNVVGKACAEMGIEVIDIVSDLREAGKENPYLYFPLNRHWTSDGHEVVAETLSRALK